MKKIALILFSFFSLVNFSYCQNDFVEIKSNKMIGLLSFVEASTESLKIPGSLGEYIYDHLGDDETFNQIIGTYSLFDLSYAARRQGYPQNRRAKVDTYDLIWVAASNATSIRDFSERIMGYLPHYQHNELITLLKQVEPYYDHLIWENEQENILRIERQLSDYKNDISELFLKASLFYNTQWDTNIHFKIMLYPTPLEKGRTLALAMGSTLICDFLSHREDDYKNRLGVIIHEMCHILYLEQPPEVQHQIDEWFATSKSPYAKLTYRFINEGMATAIGNGWAYEKINGEMDTKAWYTTKYIDGLAHAIFPLAKSYLENGKTIDREFIHKSISLFEDTFPNALSETELLMSEIQLYINPIDDDEKESIKKVTREAFGIRSMTTFAPISSEKSKRNFNTKEVTKVFVIHSNNNETIKLLNTTYADLKTPPPTNSIFAFKDNQSQSAAILVNISDTSKLNQAMTTLSNIKYLDFNTVYKIE